MPDPDTRWVIQAKPPRTGEAAGSCIVARWLNALSAWFWAPFHDWCGTWRNEIWWERPRR